ncbi:MAG: PASTA domain-containing protein [Clostridia bacterium]|nr:PASTA domain-containing protein [Clostridia bacterium]
MKKNEQSLYPIRRKLLIVIISITFFFCAIIGRFGYLQLVQGESLQQKALSQWTRDLPLKAERGKILDTNGEILAGTSTLYTLYVRPRAISDASSLCKAIAPVIGADYTTLLNKIQGKKVSEITVAKKLTKEQMLIIKNMNISGIYFSEDTLRYYPYGDFMTQLLGYTNVDGVGQEGLESYLDKYLSGVDGMLLTEADLTGIELENSQISYLPAISGFDVTLTVDRAVQQYAEEIVNNALSDHKAKSVSCIVMNAKSGAILAMANAPGFDLNSPPRNDVSMLFENMKNRNITDVYEPGSTFKIITAAIALNEGKVSPNSRFFDPGYRIVDGQRIKCWRTIGHGSQTFAEGVQNSCNSVFMDIALSVGAQKSYEYYSLFGLTEKTGIDLRGESGSIMIPKNSVKNVDLARMGFGHAIAITPLQLVTAATSCINGGKLLVPYICEKITDKNGKIVYSATPTVKREVISESTSKTLSDLLESVVSKGSGKHAYVNGYKIGGKTGTAQKYKDGRIEQGAYVSSFLGFAPVENPEYVVFLSVNEPSTGVYYGSLVAAPYVGSLFSNIFAHYNVAPSAELMDEDYDKYFAMPDLVGMSLAEAQICLKELELSFECDENSGIVTKQIPVAGSMINKYTVAYITAG